MIALLILVGRALALAFSGRHEVALENLALRQQLMTATRGTKRPRLDTSERFFWIVFEFPIVLRTPVVRFRHWRSLRLRPMKSSAATGSRSCAEPTP